MKLLTIKKKIKKDNFDETLLNTKTLYKIPITMTNFTQKNNAKVQSQKY